MANKLRIYFRNNKTTTLQRLDKYPNSYLIIQNNWSGIVKSLTKANPPRQPFKNAVVMSLGVIKYKELLKDLKQSDDTKEVSFYLNTSKKRFLILTPITNKRLKYLKFWNRSKSIIYSVIIIIIILIIYLLIRGMG